MERCTMTVPGLRTCWQLLRKAGNLRCSGVAMVKLTSGIWKQDEGRPDTPCEILSLPSYFYLLLYQ